MKLKSLTLIGFKSFPNKTTFEFNDGITCIVGPNGSGKSNIVDAFKWVLGEQSAKSLRGTEMMDVIFSGSAQKRQSNYAEVVLTFYTSHPDQQASSKEGSYLPSKEQSADNHRDESIVTIARRLYRNGQSEYLLNDKIVRLKDIREMFLDTGANTKGYSIIEQGKVEAFLQASAIDRRAAFDEAAGIARYKMRKIEASRRLERVEQNLLRVGDILAEVQKRLRSIKYQAGKARNYHAYSTRLAELQSLFSLAQYHRIIAHRRDVQEQSDNLTDTLANVKVHMGQLESSLSSTDTELAELQQKAHEIETHLVQLDSQITSTQQQADMLISKDEELSHTINADTARREQLEAKIASYRQEIDQRRKNLSTRAGKIEQLANQAQQLRDALANARQQAKQLRDRLEQEKNSTIELLGQSARLNNEISARKLLRENLIATRDRLLDRQEQIAKQMEEIHSEKSTSEVKLDETNAHLAELATRLQQVRAETIQLTERARGLQEKLSTLQQEHSALQSRKTLLEQMEQQREGIGEGAKKILEASARGELPFVLGLLGDFVETDLDHAGIIEAALAGAEQWIIVSSAKAVSVSAPTIKRITDRHDRVNFICLDRIDSPATPGDALIPPGEGIVARASQLVRCRDQRVSGIINTLLGRTLVVESLESAVELSNRLGKGWRFITLGCEVIDEVGSIQLPTGLMSNSADTQSGGIIWRKSELARLAEQIHKTDARIRELSTDLEDVRSKQGYLEQLAGAIQGDISQARTKQVEMHAKIERLASQEERLKSETPLIAEELEQLDKQIKQSEDEQRRLGQQADRLAQTRTRREKELARLKSTLAEASTRREDLSNQATALEVQLASLKQQHAAESEIIEQLLAQEQSLQRELSGLTSRIEQLRQRRLETQQAIQQARQRIDALVKQRHESRHEIEEINQSRQSLLDRLDEIRNKLNEERKRHDELSSRVSDLRVELREIDVRIEQLISQATNELHIDLLQAYENYTHDESRDWDSIRAEIDELRGKIERLGNVNLDAIDEQEELQKREKFLSEQIEDIVSSRKQLTNLINRINAQCRKRFEESFQQVRRHFNELFRKLFGGGKADIFLTDPDNVLESGIEIVARPPGKELRTLSLLSGGEKVLVSLAVLFSFFKARPSPFCLLDEVDAALDEANTERFARLLKEFLQNTQFIIITHCKRTIAIADQIYGLTMHHPGVSTLISVRFEEASKLIDRARVAKKPQTIGA